MSESVDVHGSCAPRFERVRAAVAEGFRERDEVGAAVAVTVDGEPVPDLWAEPADQARTQPWTRGPHILLDPWATALIDAVYTSLG